MMKLNCPHLHGFASFMVCLMLQNPESVKIKAEMERTLSRIKVQEKELAEEQEKAHNSQDKIQRLQEECAKLAEGECLKNLNCFAAASKVLPKFAELSTCL